jgi:hypothetical protein
MVQGGSGQAVDLFLSIAASSDQQWMKHAELVPERVASSTS